MHGTEASVRVAGRFPGIAEPEPDPAWRPWVRLLDLALAAAGESDWASTVTLAPSRPAGAPLLHGAALGGNSRRWRQLLRELLRESDSPAAGDSGASGTNGTNGTNGARSGSIRPSARRRLDALGIAKAAIEQDTAALDRLASSAAVDPGRLSAVAQLAVIPLLSACRARFVDQVPAGWLHGYCPLCGAWPTVAEMRGLDRSRRLRCGRCHGDWELPVLRCPYCDELRHDRLHALVPEGDEHTRRVDVCESCKGYIKTFATLQALPHRSLAMVDLATLELDVTAQDRGYTRPGRPGFPLEVSAS
jgi:FdhE protein